MGPAATPYAPKLSTQRPASRIAKPSNLQALCLVPKSPCTACVGAAGRIVMDQGCGKTEMMEHPLPPSTLNKNAGKC